MSANVKAYQDVIIAPVISEKSFEQADLGKYTFQVKPGTNKTEIKQAIEKIFNVKVKSVNTINRIGKVKRTRFGSGKRNDTKRAIISLADGQTLDIFGTATA